jgi:proline iminopeptidase
MQNTLFLPVDDIHTLAVYTQGNPQGVPIVYLHGGPGAGCDLKNFELFDLDRCFVIFHDQRGCGRSTPFGALDNNTTWDLITDIEKIRHHFQLDKILLYGGSWGSTLALAYAQTYPEQVLGLVLRGICLATVREYQWLYELGANQLFPEAWQQFIQRVPAGENSVAYYYQCLTSPVAQTVADAALAWSNWASACLALPLMQQLPEEQASKDYLINISRIETHYFSQAAFLFKQDQLLNDMSRIAHLKGFIVHGRKDYLCPIANAWMLHQAWPGSTLTILPEAGHLSAAPGMKEALQEAVGYFL